VPQILGIAAAAAALIAFAIQVWTLVG